MSADDREPYGRIVNETRRAFAAEQATDRGEKFYIRPWEERAPSQQELDMRIGAAVAVQAVHDAGLRREALELLAFTLGVHGDRIFDAFRVAIHYQDYEARKEPYRLAEKALRAALERLGGGEGQERSDEKGPGGG